MPMACTMISLEILIYNMTKSITTHTDAGIRVRHHSDQEVQEHNNVDDVVGAIHEETPEPRECFDARQFKIIQVHQTERGPEE